MQHKPGLFVKWMLGIDEFGGAVVFLCAHSVFFDRRCSGRTCLSKTMLTESAVPFCTYAGDDNSRTLSFGSDGKDVSSAGAEICGECNTAHCSTE